MTAHWEVPRTTPRVQPPFREPRFNIGPDTRKTILVQSSLVQLTQTQAGFAGPITTSSRTQTNYEGFHASWRLGLHAIDINE